MMPRTILASLVHVLLLCSLPMVYTLPAGVEAAEQKQPYVDQSMFPKAYGVLANEQLMYPVDMADWPLTIDNSRQLFVDDYLLAGTRDIERTVQVRTVY